MNASNICVDIKINEILDFSEDKFNNSNKIITFIDAWIEPYIYVSESYVCGPLIKILEKLCQRYGYK